MKSVYLLALGLIFLSQSCTIQKRVYQSGYHVEWTRKNTSHYENELLSSTNRTDNQSISDAPLTKTKINSFDNKIDEVIEDTSTEQLLIVESSGFIGSSNLSTSYFKQSKVSTIQEIVKIKKLIKKPVKKQSEASEAQNGGKLQIVALILCILLGLIGVHRFYLGYTGLGILYLLTFGLFGIGWIIDLILLIIPNGLTPKGKSNYKE